METQFINLSEIKLTDKELHYLSIPSIQKMYEKKLNKAYAGIKFSISHSRKENCLAVGNNSISLISRLKTNKALVKKLTDYVESQIFKHNRLLWTSKNNIILGYGKALVYKLIPDKNERYKIIRTANNRNKREINTIEKEKRIKSFNLDSAKLLSEDNYSNIQEKLEWEFNELTFCCKGRYKNKALYYIQYQEETEKYLPYKVGNKKLISLVQERDVYLYEAAVKICTRDFNNNINKHALENY